VSTHDQRTALQADVKRAGPAWEADKQRPDTVFARRFVNQRVLISKVEIHRMSRRERDGWKPVFPLSLEVFDDSSAGAEECDLRRVAWEVTHVRAAEYERLELCADRIAIGTSVTARQSTHLAFVCQPAIEGQSGRCGRAAKHAHERKYRGATHGIP